MTIRYVYLQILTHLGGGRNGDCKETNKEGREKEASKEARSEEAHNQEGSQEAFDEEALDEEGRQEALIEEARKQEGNQEASFEEASSEEAFDEEAFDEEGCQKAFFEEGCQEAYDSKEEVSFSAAGFPACRGVTLGGPWPKAPIVRGLRAVCRDDPSFLWGGVRLLAPQLHRWGVGFWREGLVGPLFRLEQACQPVALDSDGHHLLLLQRDRTRRAALAFSDESARGVKHVDDLLSAQVAEMSG